MPACFGAAHTCLAIPGDEMPGVSGVMSYAMWLSCQAAHLPAGSVERLLKMTAFVVSLYSCIYRPFAPFRSPAGETFELIAPDKGIRCIGEKVGTLCVCLYLCCLSPDYHG